MSTSPHTSSSAQQEHSSHPLHKTYQSADALDEVVSTTTVGKWIALSVVLVAFAAGLVWAFFGTVPQQTEQYGIAFDPKGRTAIDWGVTGPPETFILDGDGTVLFKFVGPLVGSDYEQRFLPELNEALGR